MATIPRIARVTPSGYPVIGSKVRAIAKNANDNADYLIETTYDIYRWEVVSMRDRNHCLITLRGIVVAFLILLILLPGGANSLLLAASVVGDPSVDNPPLSCFPGAYYHKVASPYDFWSGIETTLKLGVPVVDPKRITSITKTPMDGFNAYVGGDVRGFEEIDCGLHWYPLRDAQGNWTGQGAWYPFWRNWIWNEDESENRLYWLPGDVVKMSLTIVGPGQLRMVIQDAGPNPKKVFKSDFAAPFFGEGVKCRLKRVNDVAQHGNEGKPVITTSSQVTDAVWFDSYVVKQRSFTVGGNSRTTRTERIPLDAAHSVRIDCPVGHCMVSATPEQLKHGGETVSVYGTVPSKLAQPGSTQAPGKRTESVPAPNKPAKPGSLPNVWKAPPGPRIGPSVRVKKPDHHRSTEPPGSTRSFSDPDFRWCQP